MAITEKGVKTIKELITEKNLTIPDYQRPYKWRWEEEKENKNSIAKKGHVQKLLDDILEHQKKAKDKTGFRYRIGTIVIHEDEQNKDELNIVDGQQRITTLALILKALDYTDNNNLNGLTYDHTISQKNICQNYVAIENFITGLGEKKEKFKNFLLKKCEVVYIVLDNIDEAFQFFDSQNARGKSLEAYDLLKAFHLREMKENREEEKIEAVKQWENASNHGNLSIIFNDLFAIRKYSKGEKVGRYGFTKNDVDEFKGFNPLEHNYPYIYSYFMNDCFLESNDNSFKKYFLHLMKQEKINYPFQINMQIFNGKRFFEYVQFYIDLKEKLENEKLKHFPKEYANQLFKRVLLFYYDKFGNNQIKEAIDYCYAWVFILFTNLNTLRFVSIDNKGASGSNGKKINGKSLFPVIRDALYHNQVVGLEIKNQLENEFKNTGKERKLFELINEE